MCRNLSLEGLEKVRDRDGRERSWTNVVGELMRCVRDDVYPDFV